MLCEASRDGDLATVLFAHWPRHVYAPARIPLLLCGEGAVHDPKRRGAKRYASNGDFGVVEMHVCLVECERVYVHMEKNLLCFVPSSSTT